MLQPLRICKCGFAGYLETEEGLAAYHEYKAGLMTNSILRTYAGRTLAVHYSLEYDFKDTYKKLCKFFKPKAAWKLTLRAKRGTDPKKPGAFTKDCVYLRGFLKLYEFAKTNDIRELYIGKIGIQDLPNLKLIDNIQPAKFSPHIFFEHPEIVRTSRAIDDDELKRICGL